MSRKVIPIALTSLGDDRNWNIVDEDFQSISEQGRIKLTPAAKTSIRRYLFAHLTLANQLASAPRLEEVSKTLQTLQSQAEALAETLHRLTSSVDAVAQHASTSLTSACFTAGTLKELEERLLVFQKVIPIAVEYSYTRPHFESSNGRQPRPHLQELIWQLATVYEKSGGRASASNSPNSRMPDGTTGGRNTPFIRFVFSILTHLPTEMRINFAALGDVVNRSLKARPEQRKSGRAKLKS